MAAVSGNVMEQHPAAHTLGIRRTIHFFNEFADFVAYSLHKIKIHLDEMDELPAGAPYVCFHNMDLEHLDVEAGFPVAGPLKGCDDIAEVLIPARKVVTAIDQGPYEEQDPTLEGLFEWIKDNGYAMKGEIYYQYLNDEKRCPGELLTKMIIPLRE